MIYSQNLLLSELLEIFEKEHHRNIYLVNSEGTLMGSISQGDILRGLQMGISLKSRSIEFAQLNPIVLFEEPSKQKLVTFFIEKRIQSVPIINKNNKIVKIITIEDAMKLLV